MTLEQLSWYVDNTVTKELLSVPGLAAVNRTGGVSREIRVIIDPARLQAYGITAGQVNQQLRQMNMNAAGGRAQIAGSEQSMRILGNARSAYHLGQTACALNGLPAQTRLEARHQKGRRNPLPRHIAYGYAEYVAGQKQEVVIVASDAERGPARPAIIEPRN